MKYCVLGCSDIQVSRIGIGGNIFGHFRTKEETKQIISLAAEHGVTFIDTSDTYSEGESESFIGEAIRENRRQWIICTKVGIRSHESPAGIGKSKVIKARLISSLNRLRTDYIDVYQMHHYDPITPIDETLQTLDNLIRDGKIRAYGVSNYSSEQFQLCIKTAKRLNVSLPVSMQCHYNALKRTANIEIIPRCIENRIGFIAYGALARGILSGKYQRNAPLPIESRASESANIRSDLVPIVFDAIEALKQLADQHGLDMSAMCLAWTLAQPGVSTALVGMRNLEQVRENGKAADLVLSGEQLLSIGKILGPSDRYQDIALGSYRLTAF